jgi:DHA1 family bicyclomycin/chloramphenicol resistance-like MFS transporter
VTEAAARQPSQKASLGLILLLGAMTATPPVSVDIYLPAVPGIVRYFHASEREAGLALSAFLFGLAVGQLVYGSWSDRVGRRLPLLFGFGLYLLATLGCIFAPNIEALIAFRFLQALGGCAGVVVSRAVVRDRFDHAGMLQIFSLLMLVMGIGPILAPLLGGFILTLGDWRLEFWVLIGFGLLCWLGVLFGLRETRHPDDAAFSRGESPWQSYLAVMRERRVVGYILAGTMAQASLFAYLGASPLLLINTYGLSPQAYGWVFAMNGAGLIASSQLNRRLVKTYSPDLILKRTNLGALAAAVVLTFDALTGFGGLPGIIAPLFLVIASMGFNQPNGLAGALAVDPKRAGSTSALYGAIQFVIGGVSATTAASFSDGTAVPMALVILAALGIAALSMRALLRE